MYRVTRMYLPDAVVPSYRVAHYATGDPNPTPTERDYTSRPDAWRDAFGSAAKQSVMLGRPIEVETDNGDHYRITAEKVS